MGLNEARTKLDSPPGMYDPPLTRSWYQEPSQKISKKKVVCLRVALAAPSLTVSRYYCYPENEPLYLPAFTFGICLLKIFF